jgi:short-subunit dehydrogenase
VFDFRIQCSDIEILLTGLPVLLLSMKKEPMKVALITGASGGIGKAIADQLAGRKQDLLLIARNEETLREQCKMLMQCHGIIAHYIAADLSIPGTASTIVTEVTARGLEVDMLINNAGIGSGGDFTDIPLQSELNLIQLNISSLVALTHLLLPQMQSRGVGTVVNIASMTSFMPVPYMAVYAASKAFVRSFTRAITEECKPKGVHVLLFSPGLTKTNFNASAGIDGEKAIRLGSDHNRAGNQTPEQVAVELIKALDDRRNFAISGRRNRIGAKLMALLPDFMIARTIASSYRKGLKL